MTKETRQLPFPALATVILPTFLLLTFNLIGHDPSEKSVSYSRRREEKDVPSTSANQSDVRLP